MSATPRREPKTINTIFPVLKPGEPGDEVVDGIVVEVVLLTGVVTFCVVEVEFEGSVVALVFLVLFEVVVRTVVVYVTGIVIVWFAFVVDSGPNVIIVGEGGCVVGRAGRDGLGGDGVAIDGFIDNFFVGGLVCIPAVGETVSFEIA